MRRLFAGLGVIALATTLLVAPALTSATPATAAGNYRILITGDSITQGSSGDYTWRYRLWNKLASTAPGEVTFVGTRTDLYDNVNDSSGSQHYAASFSAKAHSAQWGTTFGLQLDNISSQVSNSNANVLVIMLGSNDLAYQTSPAQTVSNLRTYIQKARAAKPGIDVVVGEVVNRYDPWAQDYWLTSETSEYASRIRTLASELNSSSQRVVVAATRTGWDAREHTWDGTHPNPTGEKVIAQRVSEALANLGIGASSPNIISSTAWSVAGPSVSLASGTEQASLGWSRTSTGSTGMFIEQRLTNNGSEWARLPYAVSGNGWTAEMLVAGGTYQYRVVPSKGWSTGTAGPASGVTVGGPPLGAIASVNAIPGYESLYGGQAIRSNWDASSNATGYKLAYRVMSRGSLTWETLPYAISDRTWLFEPLLTGRRYQLRVTPNRGYINGTARASSVVRTDGLAGDRTYVAIGDSYSAGLGASGSESSDGCYVSANAWPRKLQPIFNARTLVEACSGAETSGRGGRLSVTNQIPYLTVDFEERAGHPELVTLTVGGNDVGFSDVVKSCLFGNCTSQEDSLINKIDDLQPKLASLYADVKSAAPYADIVVGGYPGVLEPNGGGSGAGCGLLSGAERVMASQMARRLNTRISSAAMDAGVWSVGQNVWDDFAGHNACSSSPWIHAVNGDFGGEVGGVVDNKSFHPNDGGQLKYAQIFDDYITMKAG
ncbi:MAG: GDSL-type esterase/lipase family protein [Propionibacteriales bacterium]|nr:GDSL-type esterase/lipase family protein [Propionibacteriales bacterium]